MNLQHRKVVFVVNNQMQIFSNDIFGNIRTTIINNEPWFVGKGVATILGYAKPLNALATHIDEDDSLKQGLIDSMGRTQETTFINESGLYSLILSSKMPNAKKFKRWVTSEVLPAIRRTGGYIPISSNEDELTIMAKAHKILERTLEEKNQLLETKSKALAIAQPKADKYDKLMSAKGYISFNVAAKQLGWGRNKLMAFLRDKDVLFRDGLSNIAYQKYCKLGYFVVKFSIGKNGYACGVTKVTPKGLDFIYKLLSTEQVA